MRLIVHKHASADVPLHAPLDEIIQGYTQAVQCVLSRFAGPGY